MMNESKTIDARPTKDFFIRMLVKDIPLIQVIPDLVDNCVDGARRIREDGDFSGLWVRIETDRDYFKIADNCGGISVELAEKYAFRFGRPEDMPMELVVAHSTGQFGIGMKRALFKLGSKFKIESKTDRFHFVVVEDVEEWRKKEEWEFEFKELEEDLQEPPPPDERGTIIVVTSLHESVAEDFALENFQTRLKIELEAKHQESMQNGLTITVNGIPLQVRLLELLHSGELKPAYREMSFTRPDRAEVKARIYVGIAESEPLACGWHIFCNGRLILEADKDRTTGWGDGNPRYHPQFNRFRGYTFFDSDDVALLPWNTTKDGVDADSPTFRAVRLEMIKLMRPVINFLNRLDAEKDKEPDDRLLEEEVKRATLAKLSDVATSERFLAPKPVPRPRLPRKGRIQYSKPIDEIDRVKRVLKVKTHREAGEKTFEYFLQMECED